MATPMPVDLMTLLRQSEDIAAGVRALTCAAACCGALYAESYACFITP